MAISRRCFLAGASSLLAATEPAPSRLLLSDAESTRLRELGGTAARPRRQASDGKRDVLPGAGYRVWVRASWSIPPGS